MIPAVVIDALAVYRLTRMLTTDRVSRPFRRVIEQHYGPTGLGYLVTCDWCSSAYVAGFVVMARRVTPRLWDPIAKALALSATAGLIAEHT